MIRLLLVSASPAVRAGLQTLLATEDEFSIVGAVSPAGWESLDLSEPPDVLIVDSDGIEMQALDELLEEYLSSRLIFLGLPADGERWLETRRGQAWGYLPRDAEGLEIAFSFPLLLLLQICFDVICRFLSIEVKLKQHLCLFPSHYAYFSDVMVNLFLEKSEELVTEIHEPKIPTVKNLAVKNRLFPQSTQVRKLPGPREKNRYHNRVFPTLLLQQIH